LKTIVLFTASYPYDIAVENTFLEEELFYLNKYFRVIIIPQIKKGKKSNFIDNLENIEVWEDLEDFRKSYILKALDIKFLKELKHIKKFSHLKNLVAYYSKVKWLEKYFTKKFMSGNLKNDFIYYTFWFDIATTALLNLINEYNFKLITRVHGGDLFFERHDGYIPFRLSDIKSIDKVIAVSKYGYDYLLNRYNLNRDKIELFYLLSKDYGIINPVNKEKVFKIVNCAMVVPLKRIDDIIVLLSKFSNKFSIPVEYTHIGDGVDFAKIKSLAKKFSTNLFKINLIGFKNIEEIMNDIYKNNPYDVFITLSKTEGGVPFALREAASCEIPLIGTNVGGIPEIIINDYNGYLVDVNYREDDVLEILYKIYKMKFTEQFIKMRKNSRKLFLEKFDPSKNHEKFAKFLGEL